MRALKILSLNVVSAFLILFAWYAIETEYDKTHIGKNRAVGCSVEAIKIESKSLPVSSVKLFQCANGSKLVI